MYSPEKTKYRPTLCSTPAWNSFRHPGLNGVRFGALQPSKGFRTASPHPMLESTRFSLKGVSSARVGDAKNRVAGLDVVSDTEARLRLLVSGQAVVEITAQAKVERPASLGDRILEVEGELLHVRV